MTNSRRSLALIGAGHWGKNLARNFDALGALHTICEASPELLGSLKGQYPEVKLTSDYEAVLRDPSITKVVIAAPAALHYELGKQALLAGKDLYVEKPLCLDSAHGEELIRLAHDRHLILMVGHLLQYHPCLRRMQELLISGEMGKLQYIVSNRLNLGKIRKEENALWSFAPHDISVILSLCGHRLPEQVRCVGQAYLSKDVVDTSLTMMRFGEDVMAHVYVSWMNPFKEQKLTVIGSTAMAVFDDTKPWEDKLVLYRNHLSWTDGNTPTPTNAPAEKVVVPQSEPLKNECEHFLTCCETRARPRTDGHEALRVLKVLQAAQASLNEDGTNKDPSSKRLQGLATSDYYAHPTAIVDPDARIGSGVKIWHFSHIMNGTHIGDNCKIGQNVVVSPGVTLGRNVKVQNNVSIYSGVVCEDDVFLGPSCVFTNVINPRSAVSRRDEYLPTPVRKGVTIGANATIVCGHELGEHCFIGAGAVVTKDVKPFALMVGNPARQMGWMSRFGEKLDIPTSLPAGEKRMITCSETGDLYCLNGNRLSLVESAKAAPTVVAPALAATH